MADLPNDRRLYGPTFSICDIEMSGPFLIKDERKEIKRFWALFTCLASREVHIECTYSMNIGFLINNRVLRSENWSNIVGEGRGEWEERNQKHLQRN